MDDTIIFLDQFHPSMLSQVKLPLRGKILKTFMIGVDETFFFVKIVSPYFQCKHNGNQFQIMSRVILFMRLQLP